MFWWLCSIRQTFELVLALALLKKLSSSEVMFPYATKKWKEPCYRRSIDSQLLEFVFICESWWLKWRCFFFVSRHKVDCRGGVQLGGSSTGLFCVGPTKVKACKSFSFTESSLVLKIKNTFGWLLLSHYIWYFKKENFQKFDNFVII